MSRRRRRRFTGETAPAALIHSEWRTPWASFLTLRIYSFDGRLVRTMKQGDVTVAGTYEMSWNGTDDHGRNVSSGIYLVRTTQKAGATEESAVLKLVLTK